MGLKIFCLGRVCLELWLKLARLGCRFYWFENLVGWEIWLDCQSGCIG